MGNRFENAATAAMLCCALAVTALAFRHEFRVKTAKHTTDTPAPEQFVDWRSFERVGRRVGPSDARVTLLEFVDYECPFCRTFSRELSEVLANAEKKYPGQVATVFVHYPLSMHRFARVAGQVAECADAQGQFQEMQTLLFAKQDSFGIKPWSEYGREAGLKDSLRFARCLRDSTSERKVLLGLALAEKLKLHGTPTVLVNGWRFSDGAPSMQELDTAVARAASGRPVIDASHQSRVRD